MTIRYQCEECGAALNINDELAGTEGNCPRCQVQFTVPAADSDADPTSATLKPAALKPTAPKPATEVRQRSSNQAPEGSLSDDDISNLLNSDSPPSAASERRGSVADFDDDAPTEEDEEPRRGRKKRPAAGADDSDADDSADETDNESEQRSRKQKTKLAGSPKVKSDSTESASIASHLMGRGGQPAVRDETEKRKRRPFGGREERREGELSSLKDVVTYFAKMGWPFVLGAVVFLGLCVWISVSMMKQFVPIAPLAPVTGTVTIDGKPLKSAWVKFVPKFEGPDADKRGTTSVGFTDAEGKYTLTYANDDGKPVLGAIIGSHQVQIQLNDPSGAQLIPQIYSTYRSELKADVAKGKGPFDFALKSEPVEKTE